MIWLPVVSFQSLKINLRFLNRMVRVKKTIPELLAGLDMKSITFESMLRDLDWAARERERLRVKDARYRQIAKEAKEKAAALAQQAATGQE